LYKIFIATLLVASVNLSAFDLKEVVSKAEEVLKTDSDSKNILTSNLNIESALKEALNLGAKNALETLGAKNGFLDNKDVKIEFPESLELVKTGVVSLGGEKKIEEFVVSMNQSAVEAIPKTIPIFTKAIDGISIESAKKILLGEESEATKYLKTNTKDELVKSISPIIKESMAKSDVMTYYNAVNSLYQGSKSTLDSALGENTKELLSMVTGSSKETNYEDIESYVVDETLNGIFFMIAEKEKQIREKPIFRTTKSLKEVFKLQD